MLIAIDCGHGCAPDIGASGNGFLEDKLVFELGELIAPILESHGHTVILTRPTSAKSVNDSLNQRVLLSNKNIADLFVSIHFNAFSSEKANGAEVFISSPTSLAKRKAKMILNNICGLGYRRRGVKIGNFVVIKGTRAPAILVECCFLTNKNDMLRYNKEQFARAIAFGILEKEKLDFETITLDIPAKTILKPSTEQSSTIYQLINQGEKLKVKELEAGIYTFKLFGEEENHYLVEYEGEQWFLFVGHTR